MAIKINNTTVIDDSKNLTNITNASLTGELSLSGASPQIKFTDTDGADFWLHVNGNNFYILPDRTSDGSWETPYALQLDASNNTGQLFGNTIWHAGNDGSGSGLDADTLDGNHASAFATASHSHTWDSITSKPAQLLTETISAGSLAVGWYTIAINAGDRASAKFIIADTTSGLHQTVHFYASHHFGAGNNITILHNDWYGSGGPVRYIRIKEGDTYSGALLQIYIDSTTTSGFTVYMYEDVQSSGFVIKNFVADGTDPGGLGSFAAITNVAAQVDLDVASMVVSDDIYIGGATAQYKALHANNYSSYALPLSGGTMTGAISFAAGQTWPTFNQNTTGTASSAGSATRISFSDRRSTVQTPGYFGAGVDWSFMQNSTDGLSDGGTYHGVMHYQPYSDASGGGAYELGFTDNNNLWIRGSSGALTTWGGWKKVWDSGNLTNLNQLTNGPGYTTNTGTVTSVSAGNYLTGGPITTSGTLAVDATSTNTASKVVARDAGGNFSAGTITAALSGNATTATTAANLSGFTNTNSAAPIVGADALTNNGIGYVSSMSLLGQIDGALYGQAYSTSWVHQIYGDYRTGQIALRGKNNGVWQAWRTVWDSGNLTNLNQLANGPGYITTSASITGSAATLTTARTLTIGSTGKAFNGSANVEWTLTEIGAAAATHTHSYLSAESDTLDTVTQRGSTTTSAISITNTTPSSGTSVGALVVSGGIACAGTIRAQALTSATTVVATNFVTAGELYADSTAYIGGLVSPFSSDGGYATGTVELDSFSSGLYTGAKYIVEITRDFDRKKRISEFLLVVEDYPQGPNLKFTEYGILNTGTDNLGYCQAVMLADLVKVQFVRTGNWGSQDCTWKVIKLGKMISM